METFLTRQLPLSNINKFPFVSNAKPAGEDISACVPLPSANPEITPLDGPPPIYRVTLFPEQEDEVKSPSKLEIFFNAPSNTKQFAAPAYIA